MSQAKSNEMGVVRLTILMMVSMTGSGIIMLSIKLTEVGTISIIPWLVTATGSVTLAQVFAECSIPSHKSGDMGDYTEYVSSKSGNFMVNYACGVSLSITNVVIATSAIGYGTELLGTSLSPVQIGLVIIGALWVCTVANFGGVCTIGQISSVTVQGVIIPVAGLYITSWFWFSPALYVDSWNPHHTPFFSTVGSSIAMTLQVLLGLESACMNIDVVEDPERNVPITVLGDTLGAVVIYIVSTNVITEAVPNMELTDSTASLGLVFVQMFIPEIGKAIMVPMVMSRCGSLLDWQFTIAQVFRPSFDKDYFPKIFSRVTKVDAPVQGMLAIVITQNGLALMTTSPSLNSQFNVLVNLVVVTNITPCILSVTALVTIQKIANVSPSKARVTDFTVFVDAMYSSCALYSPGEEVMLYGPVVTFLGWTPYSLASPCSELKNEHG